MSNTPSQRRSKMSYLNQLRFGGVLIFLLLFIGLSIILIIDTVNAPDGVHRPYQETNQPLLENARPGDLIICAIENPIPPTTTNITRTGLVIHNVQELDRIDIILFNTLDITNRALFGVEYSYFNDCKVSIIKDHTAKRNIIGEVVLNRSQTFIEEGKAE